MTEQVLTIRRVPSMKYPLANRRGIEMFGHLVEAAMVWSRCTKPQKALLAELVPPVVEVWLERGSLSVEDLPMLPERVSRSSWAALRRRGLADDQGRLTWRAVHTWFYAVGAS